MGEQIPLSLLVGGKEQKVDLAYLEGHDTSSIQSPVQSDGDFGPSPTSAERRGSYDLEGGRQKFPAVEPAVQFPSEEANIVSWDGPDDPDNPLNWSSGLKWSNIALVSAITFITFVRLSSTRYISPTNISVGL